jgi:hypothetical protein
MTFLGFRSTHEPVNQEVILVNGCFSVTRYWFQGEVPGLKEFGSVRFVDGWQGRETTVDISAIKPIVVFEVVEAVREAA